MLFEIWYQTHFLYYEYFNHIFSQHFLNYNFHIILNNNTWKQLLGAFFRRPYDVQGVKTETQL